MLTDKAKEKKREYYLANKEKHKKWRDAFYARNKEKHNANTRVYYQLHKLEFKEYFKRYSTTENGKDAHRRASLKYRMLNLLKYKAHIAVNNALRLGKLKKETCKICDSNKVDAHHYLGYDEDSWLKVEWYCRQHHKDLPSDKNIC